MTTQSLPRGPWRPSEPFDPTPYYMRNVIAVASDGSVLAHVNCAFGNGPQVARAIAAVPNLLAALKRAEYLVVGQEYLDALDVMRKAIAEVEGKS